VDFFSLVEVSPLRGGDKMSFNLQKTKYFKEPNAI